MKVLALDPGFGRLGIAVLEKRGAQEVVLYSACVETDKNLPFPQRLQYICDQFLSCARRWAPDIVALERLYFSKNTKTALQVAEARGALLARAAELGIAVSEFTPNQIKLAVTGYGGAPKSQVSDMVYALVSLSDRPRRDDEMDAIAVGITALAVHSSFPQY